MTAPDIDERADRSVSSPGCRSRARHDAAGTGPGCPCVAGVDELGRAVQDVPHRSPNAFQPLLATGILLPRARLLLTVEHDQDVHQIRIGLAPHHHGPRQTRIGLLNGLKLPEHVKQLRLPLRLRAHLLKLSPHARTPRSLVSAVKPSVLTLHVSVRTGEGLDRWVDWLTVQVAERVPGSR